LSEYLIDARNTSPVSNDAFGFGTGDAETLHPANERSALDAQTGQLHSRYLHITGSEMPSLKGLTNALRRRKVSAFRQLRVHMLC
jgi:hypothetical protein